MAKDKDKGKDKDKPEAPPVDRSQESLFREVEEDLQRERYASLWKRYGSLVVGAAVALVVGVAAVEIWRGFERSAREEASEQYAAAAALAGEDPAAARAVFAEIAEEGPEGYAFVAALREAAALRRGGDEAAAVAAYDRIAAATEDPVHAGLARLLAVMTALEDDALAGEPEALRDRLVPLAEGDGPWRHTAGELIGYIALRTGDTERARTVFTALAEDPAAPASLRNRAARMAAAIGG